MNDMAAVSAKVEVQFLGGASDGRRTYEKGDVAQWDRADAERMASRGVVKIITRDEPAKK